jgi:hypothetical protein
MMNQFGGDRNIVFSLSGDGVSGVTAVLAVLALGSPNQIESGCL